MLVPGSANPLLLKSAAAAGGYQISRSLRFNASDSAYCSRVPASAGNRKTWTWAGWVKRSNLAGDAFVFGATSDGFNFNYCLIYFRSDNTLQINDYVGGNRINLRTTAVFRDPSAWYHIVFALDTTQTTSTDRCKLYVNGIQVTAFGTSTYPAKDTDLFVNSTNEHYHSFSNSTYAFGGYLADIWFLDGLTPTSATDTTGSVTGTPGAVYLTQLGEFSATTGVWQPKAWDGAALTGNSYHLDFADNSSLTTSSNVGIGKDTSGLGNYWVTNNLSVTVGAGNDSLVDVPTNGAQTDTGVGGEVRGNYCTANPVATSSSLTLSNGNLQVVGGLVGSAEYRGNGTIGVSSGKWYFETTLVSAGDNTAIGIGQNNITTQYPGQDSLSYAFVFEQSKKINNNSQATYGSSLGAGDVFMCAFDLDNNKIFFGKNGTWFDSSVPASGTSPAYTLTAGTYLPIFRPQKNSGTCEAQLNFGQRAFAYTAPSGFKALCTANLPAPLVTKPSTVFDVKLYTGNGSTQTISGLGFSSDLIWTKSRSQAYSHNIYDIVRGVSKNLFVNETSAENTDANTIKAFNSDGFQLGSNDNGNYTNGGSAVAWTWDAGSSTVSNTQGSITSSVRANATAGFSIVTYTGSGANSTIGHGLGIAPQLIITKNRSSSAFNWGVYHASAGNTGYLKLNLTDAFATQATWQNTSPTSTVFYVGNYNSANQGGDNYVAYCFAPVVGYSSFGSYTGNGSSTDNTFVYTGMRPRFVMLKRSDSTGNWVIWDAVRNTYNVANSIILPNSSAAEYSPDAKIDILSNGFKVRDNSSDSGINGATYIYAAFAEFPFNYSRAR